MSVGKRVGFVYVDAQFTYNSDVVQIAFTALGGGNPLNWTEQMRAALPTYVEDTRKTGYAIAQGSMHCTTIFG
eukprot:SAG31_NODE_30956_length_374_cov_0.752727_1_plen_72_part_01